MSDRPRQNDALREDSLHPVAERSHTASMAAYGVVGCDPDGMAGGSVARSTYSVATSLVYSGGHPLGRSGFLTHVGAVELTIKNSAARSSRRRNAFNASESAPNSAVVSPAVSIIRTVL